MFKKIVCVTVLAMLAMPFSFASCEESGFALNHVLVFILEDYYDRYDANEFVVEDFNWENVKNIEYITDSWADELTPRMIRVYLKKQGKKQVYAAVEHFDALYFVKSAGPNWYSYTDI